MVWEWRARMESGQHCRTTQVAERSGEPNRSAGSNATAATGGSRRGPLAAFGLEEVLQLLRARGPR